MISVVPGSAPPKKAIQTRQLHALDQSNEVTAPRRRPRSLRSDSLDHFSNVALPGNQLIQASRNAGTTSWTHPGPRHSRPGNQAIQRVINGAGNKPGGDPRSRAAIGFSGSA